MEKPAFDPDVYQAVLKQLGAIAPPLFIMGGFAEEALLDRHIAGRHADLDVLATPDQITHYQEALGALGLVWPDASREATPGRPLVLALRAIDLDLELWACTPEPDRTYRLELDNRMPHNHFFLWMPTGTFQYPPATIEGIPIQTVSPLALYLLRAASGITRHTGEKRLKDLAMQERLRKAFLADRTEEELAPRLEYLPD